MEQKNSHDQCWVIAPEGVKLAEDAVHVWRAELDISPAAVEQHQQLLTTEERAKAERFYFARDRRRWTVARGVLRTLLGQYTHTEPQHIAFCLNDYGKPALVHNPLLQFNMSHSADLALYAFAWRRTLGIDVEYMRPAVEYDEIARHSFSSKEQMTLHHLAEEQKSQAFYRCWTRKEAYIKARGLGLSLPLGLFDVSMLSDEPARLLASREEGEDIKRWEMRNLSPDEGYAGALTVEGSGWHVCCWHVDTAQGS